MSKSSLLCFVALAIPASSVVNGNDAFKKRALELYPQADTNKNGALSDAEKQRLLRRSLNEKSFEPNMGPDGAFLMGGRLDREGSRRGIGAGDWTCAMPIQQNKH